MNAPVSIACVTQVCTTAVQGFIFNHKWIHDPDAKETQVYSDHIPKDTTQVFFWGVHSRRLQVTFAQLFFNCCQDPAVLALPFTFTFFLAFLILVEVQVVRIFLERRQIIVRIALRSFLFALA